MRTAALAVIFFVFAAGSVPIAHAAAYTRPPATLCKAGTTTVWSSAIFSAEQGKTEYANLLQKNNFCTNEVVTLGGALGNYLQDKVTCICPDAQSMAKVGCAAGQTQPTITTTIDKAQTGCSSDTIVISKCAPDPDAAYAAACGGQNMSRIEPNAAAPATVTPDTAVLTPTEKTERQQAQAALQSGDPAQYAQVLSNFSKNSGQITAAAQQNPAAAQTLLQCIANGCDQNTLSTASTQIGINSNLTPGLSDLAQASALPPPGTSPSPSAPNGSPTTATQTFAPATVSTQALGSVAQSAFAQSSSPQGTTNPFSGLFGNANSSPINVFGSPFASTVSPPATAPIASSPSSPVIQQIPQPLPTPAIVSIPSAIPQSTAAQLLVQALQNAAGVPIPPSATIIAQPSTTTVGSFVTISWSSVGMSVPLPCVVTENTSPLIASNDGTTRVLVSATGTITFALSCTPSAGGMYTQSTSVTVQ